MPPFIGLLLFLLPSPIFALLLQMMISASSSSPSDPLHQLAHRRHKRDFMFAAGNSTDPMPNCFQDCNREWRLQFEQEFDLNATDFYDFPFHPKVLDYASFLGYCRLADWQTQCFIERCGDQSADRVFSPSNFLCSFKRQHFLRARACLEEAEPISFLRCDQNCHPAANGDEGGQRQKKRAELGKVFVEDEMAEYERELDTLCTFQQCYGKCHEEIMAQICAPGQAAIATELVRSYLQWHSADLLDWHILTGNEQLLPGSCAKLARKEVGTKGKEGGKGGGGGGGMKRRLMKEGKLEGNGGEGGQMAATEDEEDDDDPVLKAMEVVKV